VLKGDLPERWLESFAHPEQRELPRASTSKNLWMGVPGVTTSWHYDEYANFFLHLEGSKRVLILPPSAYYSLHFFPALHPYYRKSQVVWEECEDLSLEAMRERFPGWEDIEIQSVVLRPGDVLYLPPYWSHRVETLGERASVSLSLWSSSRVSSVSVYILNLIKQSVDAIGDKSLSLDFFQAAMHKVLHSALPALAQRSEFFDNLINRQYMTAIGNQFDYSACRECEPPTILSSPAQSELASTVDVVVAAVIHKLRIVQADIKPIVLGFVLEKGINKLFFDSVHVDLCFIIQCLANHLR